MNRLAALFKNKIALRFLFSYFLILLIPVFLNWQTYKNSVKTIENYTNESNIAELVQIMNEVDNQISEFNNLSIKISNDRSFRKIMNLMGPATGENLIQLNESIEKIYNYVYDNKSAGKINYYIYLYNLDYIMTTSSLYSPKLYYSSLIRNYKQYNPAEYETWLKSLSSSGFINKYIFSEYEKVGYDNPDSIIFMRSVPIGIDSKPKAVLVVDVSKSELRRLFNRAYFSADTYSYIEDENGVLITSVNGEKYGAIRPVFADTPSGQKSVNIGGDRFIAAFTVSPITRWKYVVMVPEAVLFHNLRKIQTTHYLLLGAILLIGVLAAFLFTNINSRPLFKLTKSISEFFGESDFETGIFKKDPYNVITTGVSRLISDSKVMQQDIESQKPNLKNSFLSNLLTGRLFNETEIYATAGYLQINLDGDSFFTALIRIYNENETIANVTEENINEINIWKTVVKNALISYYGKKILVYDIDQIHISVLFNLKAEEIGEKEFIDYAKKRFAEVNEELKKSYNMNIFAGFSGHCQNPSDLWRSYRQSELALSYAWGESAMVFYDSISSAGSDYFYPPEMEQRLLNLAKVSDYTQIEKNLDILYSENFAGRTLSIGSCRELLFELRATINKLIPKDSVAALGFKLKDIGNKSGTGEGFEVVKEVYRAICEINATQKNSTDREFIDGVKIYINENYQDPDLGLYKIASGFNLSEGYFSALFKEQIGVNFTEYLEKMRLEKSIELLKTTNDTIDAIAQKVGYNSAQSYRRAFKKIYSYSPTILRK